ncbi:MAG: DNA methyltransferase [Rhodospirillales bacterium]
MAVAREMLTTSGSIFVQISDENLHLIRCVLDEVFGCENFVALIPFRKKTMPFGTNYIEQMADFIIWYGKDRFNGTTKYRKLFRFSSGEPDANYRYVELENGERRPLAKNERESLESFPAGGRLFRLKSLEPSGPMDAGMFSPVYQGKQYGHPKNGYGTTFEGISRLGKVNRIQPLGKLLNYVLFFDDKSVSDLTAPWFDTAGADNKIYAVQTNTEVVKRCMLMTTDPGDLVVDPTCGSGTTAYVAEQWGRRWITIDTSRVALALARQRLMAARFPYYILKDSKEGAEKEAEITGHPWPERNYGQDIRLGFVYERVPHITLKAIANNAEIDVIYERWQQNLEPVRARLNKTIGESWEEWEIPREEGKGWPKEAKDLHAKWWKGRRKREEEIDASIARNADVEFLYDRPYETKNTVRVTGPFTVESLSPHRVLPTDEDDAMLEVLEQEAEEAGQPLPPRTRKPAAAGEEDFVTVVLENLKAAGVQNTKKNEQLEFTSLKPWAGGKYIHAEGRYMESDKERRAAICIGPEYGTVSYQLVREAAREAVDLFDTLVVCGFAFEPQVGEDTMSLGRLTVLKAHMNQDLHMAEHLKKTGAGHLFVVFGEPEIEIKDAKDGQLQLEIKGVDVFDPTTGEVRSGSTDDIACWFIDTNYDEESFFVRHAYFLGAKDPYERLKRTLKAEIDEQAWATLYSATSRPFPKPATGRIAVKVINHYGDEVLKVYSV